MYNDRFGPQGTAVAPPAHTGAKRTETSDRLEGAAPPLAMKIVWPWCQKQKKEHALYNSTAHYCRLPTQRSYTAFWAGVGPPLAGTR
jgi:hypothetical protein